MNVDIDGHVVLMYRGASGALFVIPDLDPSPVVPVRMAVSGGNLSIELGKSCSFASVPTRVDGFGITNTDGELLCSQPLPRAALEGDTVSIEASASLDDDVHTSTLADMTTDTDSMTMDEWLDAAPVPSEAVEATAAVEAAEEALEELVNWLRAETWSDFATSLVSFYDDRGYLSPKQIASATSMRVKVEAKRTKAPTSDPVTEDGMYLHPDGTVYKVQVAHHGSGNLYAKRLVVDPDPMVDSTFVFESGAIRRLTPSMKMTLEQAQAFGSLYGVCCVCARVLTNEASIADGIGPVCRTRVF